MSFEIGPIRPPSEAHSLLVRVTRNCPWNRCVFCPVYKGERFSLRDAEDIKHDIAEMGNIAAAVSDALKRRRYQGQSYITHSMIQDIVGSTHFPEGAMQVVLFLAGGGKNAFLQDANSLIMPAENLVDILQVLHHTFPTLRRVTSYARSQTLMQRTETELTHLRNAGLHRIHVGMESGSDSVLALMKKGITGEAHILAGIRVKAAGFELSEYIMPGLGGREYWQEHARETARVCNAINPDFIRLRTTAIPPHSPFCDLVNQGEFEPMDDGEVVDEIGLFLENLEVTSQITSNHVLNLLPELEGQFPQDKARLMQIINGFQAFSEQEKNAFIKGRRAGLVNSFLDVKR